MSLFINHYSFVILSVMLLVIAGVILLARKARWIDFLAFGVILLGLMAAWMILRPRQTSHLDDARAVQKMIGAGTPVLLEFQSPYCLACTAIKPTVDDLQRELGENLYIIRVNVQEPAGRELASVYRFQYTPTFIFFDSAGGELWRQVGSLDSTRVRLSLE